MQSDTSVANPLLEYFPAEQGSHKLFLEYFPAGQEVQVEAPKSEILPRGQEIHASSELANVTMENFPARHAVQNDAFCGAKDPIWQAWHAVEATNDACEPPGHN